MKVARDLKFGNPALSRHFCPQCGDGALFRNGVCVRTGCGYVLKQYKNFKVWESDIERAKRYRREKMREHRAIAKSKRDQKGRFE